MEKIEEYRHFIEPEVKKLFLRALKQSAKKIDKTKLGFIGVIGSGKNEKESHDIDVLIFPNIDAKIGEAILEVTKLYENVEKYLRKYQERYYLAACPKKAIQELIYYLSSIEEGAAGLIPIHSLFFTNYKDFKNFNPKEFQKEIKKDMIIIYGDYEVIKKLQVLSQKKLEPYFFVLDFEMTSRIKSFPRHLIRTSAESLFEYLKKRYNLKINDKIPHTIPQIKKEFKKLLIELDKKAYS